MPQSEKQLEKQLDKLDKDELKKAFDLSHFDFNAILRGIQLTLVGGMFLRIKLEIS